MIKLQFLVENKTETDLCDAEHGLSVFIETPELGILFDAGASPDLMLRNAKSLGVDLAKVDAAVISHGHFDHTGGFPSFAAVNSKARIYLHRDALAESYGTENGKIDSKPCSIRWNPEERNRLEPRLAFVDQPTWLSRDVVVSGTIPGNPQAKQTEDFFIKKEDGTFVRDEMRHEQFLAVRSRNDQDQPNGIILFSGCSHGGIFGAIAYARLLFRDEPIRVVVAGMHLYHASASERQHVLEKMEQEGIDVILPVHCTGLEAICEFHHRWGDRSPIATVGKVYRF